MGAEKKRKSMAEPYHNNLGCIILINVWIILLVIDVISTLRLKGLVQHLEANPLYPYVGLAGIVLINFLILALLWLWYDNSTNSTSRFIVIHILVFVNLVRAIVIIMNWVTGSNPPTLEEAQAVTREVKNTYLLSVILPQLLPYLMGIISFAFFRLDHVIGLKEKIVDE